MDKVKTKAHNRQIVYNLSVSNRTEFASMRIFVLIIVNFILLWLFLLSTIVVNFIMPKDKKIIMNFPEGRIRADRLNIKFNQVPFTSNEPERVKLYNITTLPQKIQLWFVVSLSLGSLITNLISIASSFHLLFESNSTCQGPPRF